MIFVTMGTQIPFDRFLKMFDSIVPDLKGEEIVAQIIEGEYTPANFKTVGLIDPPAFAEYVSRARLIVAHAGMGTIISALTQGKPIVIVPREASQGEHRNDHQLATAAHLSELGYVTVATDAESLRKAIADAGSVPPHRIGSHAPQTMVDAILAKI